jgi:hypothetical protein
MIFNSFLVVSMIVFSEHFFEKGEMLEFILFQALAVEDLL